MCDRTNKYGNFYASAQCRRAVFILRTKIARGLRSYRKALRNPCADNPALAKEQLFRYYMSKKPRRMCGVQFWLRPKLKRQRRTSIVERMF
jgi:hypothetical protein